MHIEGRPYREIILARHAEPKGRGDYELSPHGKEQARKVAYQLVNTGHTPDVIFTSPSARAVQTANILCIEFAMLALRKVPVRHSASLDGWQAKSVGFLPEMAALSEKQRRIAVVGSKAQLGEALFLLSEVAQSSFEEYGKTIVFRSDKRSWKGVAAAYDAKIVDQFSPEMVEGLPLRAINFGEILPKPSTAPIP